MPPGIGYGRSPADSTRQAIKKRAADSDSIKVDPMVEALGGKGHDTNPGGEPLPIVKQMRGLGVGLSNSFRKVKSIVQGTTGEDEIARLKPLIEDRKGINAGARYMKRLPR